MASNDERYSPTPYDDDSRGRSRSRSPMQRNRSRSGSADADGKREPRVITSKRLYISNIPYDMKWKDIKDLFKKNVGDCYVSMYETPDGKSRGAGIIEFRDITKAQEAADKMHRFEVSGRKIIVREETYRDRRRHQNDVGGESGGNPGTGLFGSAPYSAAGTGGMTSLMPTPQPGLMGNGNTGATIASLLNTLAPNILHQLGIADINQINNQVFIANLDYRVNWKKLREVFGMAGNVVRAEILQDTDGKSRGLATVTYDSPVEALQAISMFNNQTLYDRTMTVKMDKMTEVGQPKVSLPSGLKGIGTGLNLGQLTGNLGNTSGSGYSGSGAGLLGPGLMNSNVAGGLGGLGGINLGQGLMGDGGGYGSNGGSGSGYGGGYNSSGGLGNLGDLSSLASLAANLNSSDLSGLSNVLNSLSGGGGLAGLGGSNLGQGSGSYGNRGGYGDGDRDVNSGSMRRDDRRSSAPTSSAGRAPSLINRTEECNSVFVRNLPFTFTWQMLKEIFKAAGDVQFAEIKRDQDNKSRGCGVVRFATGQEAKRAITLLNNTKINGRDIEVRLDSQFNTGRNY